MPTAPGSASAASTAGTVTATAILPVTAAAVPTMLAHVCLTELHTRFESP